MSSTTNQLTRNLEPFRLISQISTNLSNRDYTTPKSPLIKPLTLYTKDSYLPYNTDNLRQTKLAFQSLLGHLCLPFIIDSILQITDKGKQLNKGLRLAIGKRSIIEQHQIKSFTYSLYLNYNNLYKKGLRLVDQELNNCNIRVLNNSILESTNYYSSTIKLQYTNIRDLQLVYIKDVIGRSRLTLEAFYIATSRSILEESSDLSTDIIVLSGSIAETTLIASLPTAMLSIKPITPKITLSLVSLKGATPLRQIDNYKRYCFELLN